MAESLASRLVQQARDRLAATEPIVARTSPLAPLSSMQAGIWFLEQLSPGTNAWNLGTQLRFDGPLDVDALAHAIHDLQDRHESLRTRLRMHGDVPVQEVGDRIDLRIHDLRALDVDARELRSASLRTEQRRAFQLDNAALWRADLVRISDNESWLWVTIHHIISDGSSIDVLVRDVRELYTARLERRPAVLPPLPIQFADYAAWEQAQLASDAGSRRLQQWIGRLQGVARVDLPGRTVQTLHRMRPAGRARCIIPASIGLPLRRLCAQEDVTIFMGLAAAFNVLLARYSGTEDIAFGSPAANRYHRDTRNVMGPFLNTLVLRTDLTGA